MGRSVLDSVFCVRRGSFSGVLGRLFLDFGVCIGLGEVEDAYLVWGCVGGV